MVYKELPHLTKAERSVIWMTVNSESHAMYIILQQNKYQLLANIKKQMVHLIKHDTYVKVDDKNITPPSREDVSNYHCPIQNR